MSVSLEEIKNQIRELGPTYTFGTKKEINYLPEIMRENEKISALTSGFWQGNTWLIACTNFRIIFLDKGLIYGLKQVDIPLDKINSIVSDTGLLFGKITIWDGASKMTIENIAKEFVQDFAKRVNDTISAHKELRTNDISTKSNDTLLQLQKLAELKEKGFLTDEEFQIQKKKILAA